MGRELYPLFLPPFQGLVIFALAPRACALGYILAPLRGLFSGGRYERRSATMMVYVRSPER